MELTAGGTLGRYRLVERAGAGGMAEVWKAVQPSLDRVVAIKVLPRHLAREPGYLDRFQREARAISRLDHPNILGIHDFGEDDGYTYMVMPFLAGGTLSRNLGRPWSVRAAVRILQPLASALDYAHARGIVHRDVKPSNVLIGEGGRIVLGDFGIARMTEASLAVSAAGTLVGTPAYMSPEQVQGIPASPASDQYSLGIVAYEMVTGRRPFEAETPMAVALAHIHRPLPSPRTINPAITIDVERILFKALAKQPEDRYPSISAFVAALAEADRGQLPDPAASTPTPAATTTPAMDAASLPTPAQPATPSPQAAQPGPPRQDALPPTVRERVRSARNALILVVIIAVGAYTIGSIRSNTVAPTVTPIQPERSASPTVVPPRTSAPLRTTSSPAASASPAAAASPIVPPRTSAPPRPSPSPAASPATRASPAAVVSPAP